MTPDDTTPKPRAIWLAERRERLVANLLRNRPAEMAAEGELDPRLTEWALRLAGGWKQNLVLTGPVGSGKTWAIWKAAETAVRTGYEGLVVIVTAGQFRRVIAPATADRNEMARWFAAGLLVIDDLGTFRLSEWDLDNLGEVIDARWAHMLPTAVTSNKNELGALLGPRIASRLQHGALIVPLDGSDRRRQS